MYYFDNYTDYRNHNRNAKMWRIVKNIVIIIWPLVVLALIWSWL